MKTQHVNKDLSGLDSCKLAADLLTKPLPPVNWLLLLRGRLIWGWGGVRGRELFGRLLFFLFFSSDSQYSGAVGKVWTRSCGLHFP